MDRRIRVQAINRLIKMQLVMLAITVLIALYWQGVGVATAYLYGGSITVINTLLQRWHLISAATQAKSDAGMNLRKAYRCVAERWFITIVLFIIGFAVLTFSPLPVMIGFIVTQFALIFEIRTRLTK